MIRREGTGREVLLSTENVIGRMPSCRLYLNASFISLAHALIRYSGEFWELRDLGSTNGTFANGTRIPPGEFWRLEIGTRIAFGDDRELWELTNADGPRPAAVPLDGGEPRFFEAGAIAIPDASAPVATIFPNGGTWTLETGDAQRDLKPGQQFVVTSRTWRFESPATIASTDAIADVLRLAEVILQFGVSRNQEHVALSLSSRRGQRNLGERVCFYLAFVLARQRLQDEQAGVDDPGWLDVESVLRMVPEYQSDAVLNVEIFRFRRVLAEAGLHDAAASIERRRGQIRIGTTRVAFLPYGGKRLGAEQRP